MKVGDQVVVRKGITFSASDRLVGNELQPYPTGGELAIVEHVYPVQYYPNGKEYQSVWIKLENGGRLCTWTEYLGVVEAKKELELVIPFSWRRIQLDV
jgi:hypothetical protein